MKARRFGGSETQRLRGWEARTEGSEGRKKSRVGGMEARRPAGLHVLAPLGGSFVAFRGPLGRHHYSLANTRMPKTSQEAPELLRSTPCAPNCNYVLRFGAFQVLKSTATTNKATEEQQITKRHYSLGRPCELLGDLGSHFGPLESSLGGLCEGHTSGSVANKQVD